MVGYISWRLCHIHRVSAVTPVPESRPFACSRIQREGRFIILSHLTVIMGRSVDRLIIHQNIATKEIDSNLEGIKPSNSFRAVYFTISSAYLMTCCYTVQSHHSIEYSIKHSINIRLSIRSAHLFPWVVGVIYLVRLDAEHYARCLHRQLHAVRRLSEAPNLANTFHTSDRQVGS